jgi:hypothetical protein
MFRRIFFLTVFSLFFCYLFNVQTRSAMAHIGYFFDIPTNTDTCNKVQVSATETPVNAQLNNGVAGSCTAANPGTKQDITQYELTVTVKSYDGKQHTFAYSDDTQFCDLGIYTAGTGNGDCSCDDNPITINQTGQTPETFTMNRTGVAPYTGQDCGSYQMDFSLESVDGDTNCYYGVQGGAGLAGSAETGIDCTAQVPKAVDATVFVDNAGNGVFTTGDTYYQGATVTLPGYGTETTNAQGNAPYAAVNPGNYTMTLTVPPGYKASTINPVTLTVAGNAVQVNFGIQPVVYTISGNVFNDLNKDGLDDDGETNYTGPITVSLDGNATTFLAGGAYTFQNVSPSVAHTISYKSLPNNYFMTSPLNGPPPSFSVTAGTRCTTNGAPGAACATGDIKNLNFGISNVYPWVESTCGDVRQDNGIVDLLPAGQYLVTTGAGCTTPGIVFTGDTGANFGQGQASTTNQVVGGLLYPEVFTPQLQTSYTYLLAKAQNAAILPTNLASVCTLSDCTLPANLPHGIYSAQGDVNLNAFTVSANQNYVFLINGNLAIQGNIIVPVGSTALFTTAGNITVADTVGSQAGVTTANLDGWYIAGQSFIVNSAGRCKDLRLNIAGTVAVNALGNGGTLQNNRDLCGADLTDPAISFSQRLDFLLNAPEFLEQQSAISQEVAP